MENDEHNDIEYYIGRLQELLSKMISESEEFQKLKALVGAEDENLHLCVFSLLVDKQNAELLKYFDPDKFQEFLKMQALDQNSDFKWSESDMQFLKSINIRL